MKKRNEALITTSALLLVAALAVVVTLVLLDRQPGLGFLSAAVKDRPSVNYVFKTAGDPQALGGAVVEPGGKGYEDGAANIVTAVVADYRMLDTLGEVLVLFAAAAGVGLLMLPRRKAQAAAGEQAAARARAAGAQTAEGVPPAARGGAFREASLIVRTAVPFIMFLALITGIYIVLHGHLSPGGGFSGGAVIASAFIMRYLAGLRPEGRGVRWLPALESGAGLALLAVGLAGLFARGSFFASFLPQGSLGSFASGGILAILYSLIGIKVASELSALSADFIGVSK
jgi:multicomponent Na+:H+ antiporter subunit B